MLYALPLVIVLTGCCTLQATHTGVDSAPYVQCGILKVGIANERVD